MGSLTVQHQRSNDEADALLEWDDGYGADKQEAKPDQEGTDEGDTLGRLPVADVAPEGGSDAVAAALDHEHGTDGEGREVEVPHVGL